MGAVGSGGFIDGSADLTLGGTSEEVFGQNLGRQFLFIQNNSNGDLWVNFGVDAVQDQPSIRVVPGAVLQFSLGSTGVVPTASVHIIGATTGQAYTAKEA